MADYQQPPMPGGQQPFQQPPMPGGQPAPGQPGQGQPPYRQPQAFGAQPMPGQPPYQQQPAPGQSQQQVRYHVHHSYIWLGSIQVAIMVFVIMAISSFSSIVSALAKGDALGSSGFPVMVIVVGACFGVFALVVGIVALYQWWSYKHLYYEIGPEEFSLYSGIFNKKRMHVPYQRIQSVDQRASLIQRIAGVCTVSIDTAGGSSNKAIQVPYLRKSDAERLRTELFARKQFQLAMQSGAVPQGAAYPAYGSPAQPAAMPGMQPGAPGQACPQASYPAQGAAAPQAACLAGAPMQPGMQPGQGFAGAPTGAPAPVPGNILDVPAGIWQNVGGIFDAGAAGYAGYGADPVTYEYGLTNKELVFTGLSNNTAFFLIALGLLAAIAQLAGDLAPVVLGLSDTPVGHAVASSARLFGGNLIALGVAAFVGLAVVLWVLSTLGTCISYGGFKARRRGKRVEVEHGLLQHQFQGVDVDRVQSVVIKQSFIRRLIGYCEVSLGKIDAAAGDSSEGQKQSLAQGLVIHPFVKMDRVPEILAGLVPEFADVPTDAKPVARVALRRALIRRCIIQGTGFWMAVMTTIGLLVCRMALDPLVPGQATTLSYVSIGAFVAYALCAVLLVLDAVGAVLWFRGSSFAYNRRFMQVSNGGFSRETVSFPRRKIQFGLTRTNPFQRRARTATVQVRTAAGIGGTTTRLIDVCEEDATAWLDWLTPRGNVVQ